MNSFDHIRPKLDAAFVFEHNDGIFVPKPALSFACTLKMVQLMKVISLHTFNTLENIVQEFSTICTTMDIKTPTRSVSINGFMVIICGPTKIINNVTPEMCVDLCQWGVLYTNTHLLTRRAPQRLRDILQVVNTLEKICEDVAKQNGAEYVLVNVLYDNHYSSIASYPKRIDGLWKCHSVCHTIDDDTHKCVSFRGHPLELRHTPDMHYSGVVLHQDPKVVMCCLTSREVNLLNVLRSRATEVQREIKHLAENDLLTYEYWMWRYVKRHEIRRERKCCAFM